MVALCSGDVEIIDDDDDDEDLQDDVIIPASLCNVVMDD